MKSETSRNGSKRGSNERSGDGYRSVPFSMNRRMVAASAGVGREQSNIQALIEVDITKARSKISEHYKKTGERPSLTAYVITCLAQTMAEFPQFNGFRKGNRLILLDDVTIGVLVERKLGDELVPDSLGIQAAQRKSYLQIHQEIRAAQSHADDGLGGLSGANWVRFIPGFLLRTFIRLASKNLRMMKRYGAVGVTAVGMFAPRNEAMWVLPLVGGATVALAVGGIVERPHLADGRVEDHEHLCLTVIFNHDIVDGAPAARFIRRFSELIRNAELLDLEPAEVADQA